MEKQMVDKASLSGEKIVTERVDSLYEKVSSHQTKQWTVAPKRASHEIPCPGETTSKGV